MKVYVIKGKFKGNVFEVLEHANDVFTVTGGRRFKANQLAFTTEDARTITHEKGRISREFKLKQGIFRGEFLYTFVRARSVRVSATP